MDGQEIDNLIAKIMKSFCRTCLSKAASVRYIRCRGYVHKDV